MSKIDTWLTLDDVQELYDEWKAEWMDTVRRRVTANLPRLNAARAAAYARRAAEKKSNKKSNEG